MALVCRTGAYRTHALRVAARRAERQTAKTNSLKYAGREHLYLSPSPPSSVGTRRWDQREEQRRWAERKKGHGVMSENTTAPAARQHFKASKYVWETTTFCGEYSAQLEHRFVARSSTRVSSTVLTQECVKSWNRVHQAWNSDYFMKGSCRSESPV